MVDPLDHAFDRLKRPEYTGENRCQPCTALNVLIALSLAGVLWFTINAIASAVALIVCIGTIYLRGYLVPWTPTLVNRYLPDRIHRLFGHSSERFTPSDVPNGSDDVEAILRSTGVVVDCSTEDDLCLDETFSNAWRSQAAIVSGEEMRLERLASRLDLPADGLAFEESAGTFAVSFEGDRVGAWPSESAFLADLSAVSVLEGEWPGWQSLTPEEQQTALAALRVFIETCPSCTGTVVSREETYESCCSEGTRASVECSRCGDQFVRATVG